MKILVSGASGFVGSALVPGLEAGGHAVVRLVRSEPRGPNEARWNPAATTQPGATLAALDGADAVVHLAGESIAAKRWTPEQKVRIRDSRVQGTRALAGAMAKLAHPPRVFACASAIGYYGDRGDEVLTESSPPGRDFLAGVAQAWEAATEPAAAAGTRVINCRFGIILSPEGGALPKLLTPFKFGAGGPIGSGKQWVSWIAIADVVGSILHVLTTSELRGPVNCVAPNPVRNEEFARTVGKVLGRPAALPAPAFALRLALGEMAEALLGSQRVEPVRLKETGYLFRFVELEAALRAMVG